MGASQGHNQEQELSMLRFEVATYSQSQWQFCRTTDYAPQPPLLPNLWLRSWVHTCTSASTESQLIWYGFEQLVAENMCSAEQLTLPIDEE